MMPCVLVLLCSAQAWFTSPTDDLAWLADYAPYAAQTEVEARRCGAACRAGLKHGFRCEGVQRPLPACDWSKPVNADFSSLVRATKAPRASCAGPHGGVACYTFSGGDFCVLRNAYPPKESPEVCAAGALKGAKLGDKYAAISKRCAWSVYCEPASKEAAAILQRRLWGRPKEQMWPKVQVWSRAPPAGRIVDKPLYLARRGDCGGKAPNPAHCVADGQLFHATMELLRRSQGFASINETTVFLAGGFGFGGHAMRATGGDDMPWSPSKGVATYLLWASAKRVRRLYDRDAWPDHTYGAAAYRDVVLSPPPFHAATWAPQNCLAQVRSDVFAHLRRNVDARLERAAALGPRGRAPKPFVLVLSRGSDQRRLVNAKRTVHNLDAVVDALQRALPSFAVRVVSTSIPRPWARQVALWRRARLVVALHGGALAHALFLGPGQGLVEVTPREHSCGRPSMFAHMAIGVGAAYAGVLCRACSMARGGAVDVGAVVRVVRGMLERT